MLKLDNIITKHTVFENYQLEIVIKIL